MKRIAAALLILLFAWSSIVWAAELPAKHGRVLDSAGMIQQDSIESVENATQGEPYSFYILTIDSLAGEEPSEYANRVYDSWQLQTGDVLLLISSEERWIEMNFNNPQLLEAITNSKPEGGVTIDQFITETFIPYAQQGDFAQASIAVIEAVNNLAPIPETAVEVTEPAGGEEAAVPGGTTPEQRQGVQVNFGAIALWIAAAIVVFSVLGYLLAYFKRKKQLAEVRENGSLLLVELSQASEQLRPFVGMVQGGSEKLVTRVDGQITEWLMEIGKRMAEIDEFRSYSLNQYRELIESASHQFDQATVQIAGLREEINQLVQADSSIKALVGEISSDLASLNQEIAAIQSVHPFPLSELVDTVTKLEPALEGVQEMKLFDPIEADRKARIIQEHLKAAYREMKNLRTYLDRHTHFPDKLAETRQTLDLIISDNHLKLVEIDPFALLDQAVKLSERMYDEMKLAQMASVRQTDEEIGRLFDRALEMTRRQASLRKKNQEDLQLIHQKIREQENEFSRLTVEIPRIEAQFSSVHWSDDWKSIQSLKEQNREVEGRLPAIEQMTDDEHQHFEKAREELDQVLRHLGELSSRFETFRQSIRDMSDKLSHLINYYELSWTQYTEAISLARENTVNFNSLFAIDEVHEGVVRTKEEIQRVLDTPPYQLNELEETILEYYEETRGIADGIQQLVMQKREALRTKSHAANEYRATAARTKSRLRIRHYKKDYTSIMGYADSLIKDGYYDEATDQLQVIYELVRTMNRDYSDAVRQDRRRYQNSSSSSFGSGTSSWGSSSTGSSFSRNNSSNNSSNNSNNNSSGGSSWGSSGNSSGGSSWGSSSGNSSSGSSWGSSGGSKKNNSSGGSNW